MPSDGGVDYNQHSITAEQQICVAKARAVDSDDNGKRRDHPIYVGPLRFLIDSRGTYMHDIYIEHIVGAKQTIANGLVAEVVKWQWKGAKQNILEKYSFKCAEPKKVSSKMSDDVYFIIRFLSERTSQENPCPALDADDEFTIAIPIPAAAANGVHTFVASAIGLQCVSPVFRKMFTVEMRESRDRKVEIKDTDPEEFRAFLEAISVDKTVLPNPLTVRGLLKLADRYQVDFVKKRCEQHLINCVEIPLLERLVMADKYRLEQLKEFILSIDKEELRKFCKENYDILRMEISYELFADLLECYTK